MHNTYFVGCIMKKLSKANLIICGVFTIAGILLVILISQYITLGQKQQTLNKLNSRSIELAQEIEQAKQTLEVVSSLEYQEEQARKNGYAYPDEKRFVLA